jgi:hypothetical protein
MKQESDRQRTLWSARTIGIFFVAWVAAAGTPSPPEVQVLERTDLSMGASTAMVLAWREPRVRVVASVVGAVDFCTNKHPGPRGKPEGRDW